ncbi:YegP family protein [Aquimarina hainanensis]|uniref:YegP family protein n=1 Tax=Aquimarina hainanensis TaxID=1578017 RepID=A0ABW5NC72_9FLAO|nr:YegP family protein [Aquimarina sp. TRL1]QKX06354.1 YegP family protein [Aquimarina sp. TRL1]
MFELKNKEGSQYHFTLKAKNGQVILSSEVYNSKAAAQNGIASVQKNASQDNRYERKTAKDGRFFFNLKASNGQVIGSSQMYTSESGMENGINSVKQNAVDAQINEI